MAARSRLHEPRLRRVSREPADAASLIEFVRDLVPARVFRVATVRTAVNSGRLHVGTYEPAASAVHMARNLDATAKRTVGKAVGRDFEIDLFPALDAVVHARKLHPEFHGLPTNVEWESVHAAESDDFCGPESNSKPFMIFEHAGCRSNRIDDGRQIDIADARI